MKANTISGQRQYAFVSQFNYIREAGTEGEEKAACRIEKELSEIAEKWGQSELQIRREPFEIETWQVDEAVFTVTEPYEKTYTVRGCFAAANTAPEGVEAPFLYVENGDPVSLSHAEGKIVLINGGANAENYEKLEKAGAVGFLILTGTPLDKDEDRLPDYRTLRGVKNPKLPCAVIHYLDAMELVERGASRARLVLQQKKIRRTSKNIILRIPGTEQPEEILTLTAHYDSVPQGPGAYDNMAGAAIIMELAHYFAENRPKRTLECIWFGAEELGLCGSRAYVKAHEAELAQHRFNMNVDLAGQAIGGTVLGVAATKEACDVIMEHLKQADKGVSLINNIWSSDSNTFAWKGIPAMTLNRDGFGMHTCHDTIDWISAWSLNRSAGVLGEIAEYLADAEPFPFEREIPADFAERLKVYFGE